MPSTRGRMRASNLLLSHPRSGGASEILGEWMLVTRATSAKDIAATRASPGSTRLLRSSSSGPPGAAARN
eukprot:CAMPEP_0115076690 /NCGR_PEP_ID=MMETSP0227-20121206/16576_1 /TAXON_ID=89957 /ORGANISM="Polarella glacialis, Strain CCMP 1383" /LENGTH=69 /DNA_ID=CAMNT_0002463877 /DNA_START=265 /DNA_END=471 /DNA_ORIENTATION=-